MTVKELANILSTVDQDFEVDISASSDSNDLLLGITNVTVCKNGIIIETN